MPCKIFNVILLCSSFCGMTNMAYKQPLLEILANTFPIGTSSFGNNKSTIKPNCFNLLSINSAYSLKIKHFIDVNVVLTSYSRQIF